jgi:hypothetical protein
MFIQTESTPNPATLKFLPGQPVLDMGTADFSSAEAAGASPLAARIFAVGGVAGVFFGADFVTVTKSDGVQWDHIKPAILGAVMEAMPNTVAKTEPLSTRSRSCLTPVCVLLWRRMAATSLSTALTEGSFTCTCRGRARAVPLRL